MVAISTAWVDSQIRWEWISSALNRPFTVSASALTVVAVPDGPSRGGDTELGQPAGVRDRQVVRSVISMVDQLVQGPPGLPHCHVEGRQGSLDGGQGRRDVVPDDPTGAHVGDERHIGDPRPGRHIRDVGDPQPVRSLSGELTRDQIGRLGQPRIRLGGEPSLATSDALQPRPAASGGPSGPARCPSRPDASPRASSAVRTRRSSPHES